MCANFQTTVLYYFSGDIVELFVQYFRCFGDRSCCATDLKPYLPLVSSQCRGDLIKGVWQIVGLEDGELPDTVRFSLPCVFIYDSECWLIFFISSLFRCKLFSSLNLNQHSFITLLKYKAQLKFKFLQ